MRTALSSEPRVSKPRNRAAFSNRSFALLWAAAFLVPICSVLLAGLAAWHTIEHEAVARIERTVELLRENALRTFGTQQAMFVGVQHAVDGRAYEELRQDAALHRLLADLADTGGPIISALLLADGAAKIVSASWEFPAAAVELDGRDYVGALRQNPTSKAIGAPIDVQPMGWPIIPVARSLPDSGARLGQPGSVVFAFNLDAMAGFFASVVESPRDVIGLYRDDGTVLARYPAMTSASSEAQRKAALAVLEPMLKAKQAPHWVESPLDGVTRLVAGGRVGTWPAVVTYGLDRQAVTMAWRERMAMPLAGGIVATCLLIALTAIAQRSARVQREQAERRADAEAKLAQAGRTAALSLLAAGVAHDVKNLVQAVRSGTRVMQRRAEDPEEVRRCADLLREAAERGGRLVEAMLAFSRGRTAEHDPAPLLDTRAALAEVSELLSRTLGSGWPVRAELPETLPMVRGDHAGFEAAIVNLTANARDAMPGGGTVTIAGWTETLDATAADTGLAAGRYVVAAVIDTGVGMDAATLARVGEPFFTTKPVGAGAGLGLATVRGFCVSAHGALRIESSPGMGTTAAIWLPAAP